MSNENIAIEIEENVKEKEVGGLPEQDDDVEEDNGSIWFRSKLADEGEPEVKYTIKNLSPNLSFNQWS